MAESLEIYALNFPPHINGPLILYKFSAYSEGYFPVTSDNTNKGKRISDIIYAAFWEVMFYVNIN